MACGELAAVGPLLLELLEPAELDVEVEVVRDRREVDGRRAAEIDVLMRRAVRHVDSGPRLPVVARAIDDAEAGARGDVDRLFAVDVHGGAPTAGGLRLEQ